MKIIHLGEELDSSKEQQLFPNQDQEFGFTVIVVYKRHQGLSSYLSSTKQKVEYYNNVTEVHVNYKKSMSLLNIAIESSIHETGIWRNVDQIERVIIEIAEEKTENF